MGLTSLLLFIEAWKELSWRVCLYQAGNWKISKLAAAIWVYRAYVHNISLQYNQECVTVYVLSYWDTHDSCQPLKNIIWQHIIYNNLQYVGSEKYSFVFFARTYLKMNLRIIAQQSTLLIVYYILFSTIVRIRIRSDASITATSIAIYDNSKGDLKLGLVLFS